MRIRSRQSQELIPKKRPHLLCATLFTPGWRGHRGAVQRRRSGLARKSRHHHLYIRAKSRCVQSAEPLFLRPSVVHPEEPEDGQLPRTVRKSSSKAPTKFRRIMWGFTLKLDTDRGSVATQGGIIPTTKINLILGQLLAPQMPSSWGGAPSPLFGFSALHTMHECTRNCVGTGYSMVHTGITT